MSATATTQEPKHKMQSLLSVGQFARKKDVDRAAVYYHINTSKRIIPVLIGMDKDIYIDWKQYKDFDFRLKNK